MSGERSLAGRTAVITGAASGIGRACAIRFAAEGAAVVVGDLADAAGAETVAAIRSAGGRAEFVHVDVTVERDLDTLMTRAVDTFGSLDVLVNNAGVGNFVPFDRLTVEEWDRIHGINLRATFVASKLALPHLRRSAHGVILNMASQSGLEGQAMNEAYCASKAGVILFTRSLAKELAPTGIRVNCLCPGGVDTPLLRGFVDRTGGTIEATSARMLMGRLAQPDEIAAAALFLVSDEASYVTGVALPVDGGATA